MTTNTVKRLLLSAVIVAIVAASLLPGGGHKFSHWDKIGHFFAYSYLGVIICLIYVNSVPRFLALLAGVTLGIVMELCQSFIPGRRASLADQLANTIGILTGTAFFFIFRKSLVPLYDHFFRKDRRKAGRLGPPQG